MTKKAPYAALHLPADAGTPDLAELLKAAGRILKAHDNRSGRALQLSRRRHALMADRVGLCLTHFKQSGGRSSRLVLRILSRDGEIAQDARAVAILLDAVRTLAAMTGATEIEWLSSRTRLSPDMLPSESPRPARKKLAPIDAAEERALTESIRAALAENARPEQPDAEAAAQRRTEPTSFPGMALTAALGALRAPVLRVVSSLHEGNIRLVQR